MTATREPQLRLFIAIELTPEWLEALSRAQADLRAAIDAKGGPRLRWVPPGGIHLTLKFLGEVPEARLQSITEALASATQPSPALTLALTRLGSFGDRRGPRVIWVGVEDLTQPDHQALFRLVERLETWFAAAGFPGERGFRPHLTLARLPEDLTRERRTLAGDAAAGIELRRTAPMRVSSISLMRSHLGPGGARHERLAAFGSTPDQS